MNWQRFYRRDCPVCGGQRKDCRRNPATGLIHCRELGAAPSSYIFRGYDSIGFGMWADRGEAEAWTEEKRREWQEMRRREKEQQKARLNRLLCDSERDAAIRQILAQLELSPGHRTQLRQRGLSDAQINAGLYRTVEQWQRLRFRVDDRLAGVRRGGKGLSLPASGILCPIPNPQGELVGWQIRLDCPGDLPKYLWASPEKKRRKNGPSAHLKNGELPLACFAPSSQPHPVISQWFGNDPATVIPVALTEGVAFKPALTAHRLGIYTIGASGGHFASSPATLKTYLESIRAGGGSREAGGGEHHAAGNGIVIQPILFADAGCLANENVLQVYRKTISYLKELGYKPKIAWWGQSDKGDGDIDEIDESTLASIRLLSCQEFLLLVKKTQRALCVEAVQRGLQSLSSEPNVRFNSRYLPDLTDIVPSQGIVALKSPKGSGKSVQIQKIIESARSRGMKVISLTPRRALGREQSLKWKIEWGGDAEVTGIHHLTLLENLETIGICWDSLWKLRERDWSHTLVVIDESELALVHLLLSSTCKEKRPLILRVLEDKLHQCLAHGGMLLIADADLTDLSLNYCQALAPEAPVFVVANEYQSAETSWSIDFYTGKKDTALARLIADLATPIREQNASTEEKAEGEERQGTQGENCSVSPASSASRSLQGEEAVAELKGATTDHGGTDLRAEFDELPVFYAQRLSFGAAHSPSPASSASPAPSASPASPASSASPAPSASSASPAPSAPLALERQRRIVIPTDSQDWAEALERLLRERFPHLLVVRIDSTTTETDEGRGFVERPNEKIGELQPDVLIYTPSMGAGVSLDLPWFDCMYAFFNGVIEPSQCRQMLGRVRAAIPRTIWCRNRGCVEGSTSFLPEEIKSHLFAFHRDTNILIDVMHAIAGDNPSDIQLRQAYDAIWNRDKQEWDNPHLELYCHLMARKNYGLSHLAVELRRQLLQEGHRLVDGDGGGSTDAGLRLAQIKKQLPVEEARAISLAEDIPLEVALLLLPKPNLSQQQRHQIAKALLRAELPGVSLTPEFVYKAVTKDRRKWLNAQKLFWCCQHPDKTKILDRREWLDHLWQFSNGAVYLPDIRTYSLQVKVLRDLGLWDALSLEDPEKEYSQDGEEIRRLFKRARRRFKDIYTAFHLKVTSKTKPIQFINRLLGRIGLHLKFHRQVAKGQRFYRIELQRLNDPDRIAVLESLSQKWAQVGSESQSGASQPEPVEINNPELCCDAEAASPTIGDQFGETVEVSFHWPSHSQQEIAREESVGEKSVQVSSETAFGESQHPPGEINNHGHCCDPQPKFQVTTAPFNFPDEFIPEEHRQGVLEMEAWLTDAAGSTPETCQAILDVAIEYLRLVPQAKEWLWRAMKAGVKQHIRQFFPDYYQALSMP